jgi:hypothetical protein
MAKDESELLGAVHMLTPTEIRALANRMLSVADSIDRGTAIEGEVIEKHDVTALQVQQEFYVGALGGWHVVLVNLL